MIWLQKPSTVQPFAAKIAKAAQVGTLILGHYSTRYKEKQAFVDEAQTVFPNVVLAEDGKHFSYG